MQIKLFFFFIIAIIAFSACSEINTPPNRDELSKNYFPLSVNNSWKFKIMLSGCNGECKMNGTLTWKILSVRDSNQHLKVFEVKESYSGYRIRYLSSDSEYPDTTYENSRSYFKFIENDFKSLTIVPADSYSLIDSSGYSYDLLPNSITWLPLISFQHLYTENMPDDLTLNYQTYSDNNDINDFYADDYEDHLLILTTNIGIREWRIKSTHNGGYSGLLELLEYQIQQ